MARISLLGLDNPTPDGVVQPSSSTLRPYGRGGHRYKIGRKLEGDGDPAQVWIYQLPDHQAGETMKAVEIAIFGVLAVFVGFAIYENGLPSQKAPTSTEPTGPSLVGPAQAATPVLTPLLPSSACGHVMVPCGDDIFRPVWIKLLSSVGEITKIDSNFRPVGSGAVLVYAYSFVPNTVFDAHKLRRLVFDCAGQYYDDTDGAGEPMDAPPGSIAGQIASLACAKLRSMSGSKAHSDGDN